MYQTTAIMQSAIEAVRVAAELFEVELAALRAAVSALRPAATQPAGFTFIDLFCGIGGFHQAMRALGGRCVLACDIDARCREVYESNYGIRPHDDILTLRDTDIPEFDVLCGGFPCQAFSHAGKQGGFADTRGTLFHEIVRILRAKQPRAFLLENVKNLLSHDSGNTWRKIRQALLEAGYELPESPTLLSPHHLGVPQHRERVLLLGVRRDLKCTLAPLPTPPTAAVTAPCSIDSILLDDSDPATQDPALRIREEDRAVLDLWEDWLQTCKQAGVRPPSFPLWTDDWDSTYGVEDLPDWKARFVLQNRTWYATNRALVAPWLVRARSCSAFSGAKRKFEWQSGDLQGTDSLWTLLFQFRPSGIRVKRATYSPALVAMAQIVYVGKKQRKLCPREVARLQSFPDSFILPTSASVAYKQFGNSVNVEVIRYAARHLLREAAID